MSFCPFIKEVCKENICMMWSNDNCLVANYLKGVQGIPSEIEFDELPFVIEPRLKKEVPTWLQLSTPLDIIEEYFKFIDAEFPESERPPYNVFNLFLQTKGLENVWSLPTEVSLKISKARALLQIEQEKRREQERQLRIEREKTQVEFFALQLVDWMQENSIEKIYKKEVSRFAQEKGYDLLWETHDAIFNKAKVELDAKKRVQIEQEKRELPSLINQCIDWARYHGFKRLTKSDITAFLIEHSLEIADETKGTLYSMTNAKIKSKK